MNTNTYALLIGIDCYPIQQTLAAGSLNLAGCVRDINRIETFLHQHIGVPKAQVLKLTSTNTPIGTPLEPIESRPTRANIINGFRWLGTIGQAGDQVFIYYSGHGARVRTPLKYQRLKPGDGFDEALVPCDFNYDTDQFLRDFEIAHILRSYRDQGLEVSIVLDSCHAGGSTRADAILSDVSLQKRARTIGKINQTFPDPPIPVASDQDLQKTILRLSGRARDFNVENGWLLEPEGYTLLAACRPAEFAYEHTFEGNEASGALTYWLLDSLKVLGYEASFQALYNRILALVHDQFPDQTPQLQGERNRAPFKHGRIIETATIPVLGVNSKEIIVGAGQAQNIRPGQQFAIFPAGETNLAERNRRALVTVIDVGATSSRAVIVEQFESTSIQMGDQAVQSGTSEMKRTVKLIRPNGSPNEVIRTFKSIEDAIGINQNTYIAVATNGASASLAVNVTPSNEYVISATIDGQTESVLSAVYVDNKNAAAALINRLEHLAKYLNVYDLQNYDPISPLQNKVSLELLGVQADYLLGTKPSPDPLPADQHTPELKTGLWTFLKVKNESAQVLNITVLDLRPNWSISQIYPARAATFEPLDPGHSFTLPLCASLPDGYDEGTDLIKIVATSGPSNFRFLELPPMAGPREQVAWRGEPQSQFESLQNALTQPNLTRDFETQRAASAEWITTEVKLRTMRGK